MKQLIITLIFIFLGFVNYSQQLNPISKSTGMMRISVDPRIELLCAVQIIAGYPYINRQHDYGNELIQFFGNDTTSEAVKLTNLLAKEYGFVHDAPLDLILRLSEVPKLEKTSPYTPRTIERAGNEDNLERYRSALKQFADESHFAQFWSNKSPIYEKMVEYTVNDLAGYDPVETINTYYNESKNSYTVILSPSLVGGYGMRVINQEKKMNIYGCLSTDKIKDRIPYYSKEGLSNYLYHEFSHSFVNPQTDNYLSIVNATSALFSPLKEEMTAKSYGSWITCINEHIVRAVHIRILYSLGEKDAAENLLEIEKSRRFVYIEPILNKLKQFEHDRDIHKTTFSQFYPELMATFDSLSHANNEDLINPLFTGPVQTILSMKKVAIIYPTYGNDSLGLKSVYNYTSNIKKTKGESAALYPDTTALKTDLSDSWIMAYGTLESNLFLKEHKKLLQFSIIGDTIYTNKKFVGKNLRMITCVPNPQNRHRGMLINTATHNQSLKGVMIPTKADYLVFENIENLLQHGLYTKNENRWEFPLRENE